MKNEKLIAPFALSATLIVIAMCSICSILSWKSSLIRIEENSMAYFNRYFGVNEKEVGYVARLYEIPLDDLPRYGPEPFPVNYILLSLNWSYDSKLRPTVYRWQIEELVKGYVAKCDLTNTNTLYLFYSDWLRKNNAAHGEALVLDIVYELDVTKEEQFDDQVVEQIDFYEGGSDSLGRIRERVAPKCVPPAKY
jgi:hypothetical protein